MGMFDQMPQVEAPSDAAPMPEGMMGGQPTAAMPQGAQQQDPGYNGVVDVNGQQVEVRNGAAMFEGKPYFIIADGSVIVGEQHNLVGQVKNGKFMPPDEAQLAMLKQKGAIQGQ